MGPDTKANREAFGTAGAAETGYPQIRHLHTTDAFTRSTLAAVTGPAGGDKAEAEQVGLDRMLAEHPEVFGPDRLWVMDRNFPGVPPIAAMLATGTPVLIRVKSDLRLDRIGAFAPGRVLPGAPVRQLDHPDRPSGRIPHHPGPDHHTRVVLPGHRPARRCPTPRARRRLPVALGRLGDRPARGQVHPPRCRTGHRGVPALTLRGPDPPRAPNTVTASKIV